MYDLFVLLVHHCARKFPEWMSYSCIAVHGLPTDTSAFGLEMLSGVPWKVKSTFPLTWLRSLLAAMCSWSKCENRKLKLVLLVSCQMQVNKFLCQTSAKRCFNAAGVKQFMLMMCLIPIWFKCCKFVKTSVLFSRATRIQMCLCLCAFQVKNSKVFISFMYRLTGTFLEVLYNWAEFFQLRFQKRLLAAQCNHTKFSKLLHVKTLRALFQICPKFSEASSGV